MNSPQNENTQKVIFSQNNISVKFPKQGVNGSANTLLNLGCGRDIRKGYVNVDFIKSDGVDVVWDLNEYPYPFKDSEFEEILAYNIIEHLDKPNNFIRELWRIGKKGGKIRIIAPHFSSQSAWNDPTHVRPFGYFSFNHYDIKNSKGTSLNNLTEVKFKVKPKILFGKIHRLLGISYLANKFPLIYEYYFAYIFQSRNMTFELEVVK